MPPNPQSLKQTCLWLRDQCDRTDMAKPGLWEATCNRTKVLGPAGVGSSGTRACKSSRQQGHCLPLRNVLDHSQRVLWGKQHLWGGCSPGSPTSQLLESPGTRAAHSEAVLGVLPGSGALRELRDCVCVWAGGASSTKQPTENTDWAGRPRHTDRPAAVPDPSSVVLEEPPRDRTSRLCRQGSLPLPPSSAAA